MNSYPSKYSLIDNPYDSFMKKHLQHYGYFTGKNESVRRYGLDAKNNDYKNNDSDDADSESVNSNDSANDKEPKVKSRQNKKNGTNFKWWLNNEQKNVLNFGLQDTDYQREPRWPIELQVLNERVRHLNVVPSKPEPFYQRTGKEEMLHLSADNKFGRTVFYYNPINCGYFIKSRINGSREGCQKTYDELVNENEYSLQFESRFESGNLMKAVKMSDTDYLLQLRYDLYTNKHTQWYYFQVKNMKPNTIYQFTICNFLKRNSLYNNGMRPLMYSEIDAETKNIGWVRCGTNIKYYKNYLKLDGNAEDKTTRQFYSLTWSCTFPHANDTCYFAHCYPYTYSDMQDYIKNIQNDPVRNKICKVRILCRSLAENIVNLLIVTNQSATVEESRLKKGVVVTARVHPGETNSSWMMKGLLDFLLGTSADAKLLRDNFIFKIVPMLNPDGVIIGNYRCSLTGRDINRNYKTLLKEAFPSAFCTREMIRRFMLERELIVYCDLHGHSRKNNVFIYGCNNDKDNKNRFKERIFPVIMSKNAENSATFCGSTLGPKNGFHFNTDDFEALGYQFCDSLLDYCDPDQSKCKMVFNKIESEFKEHIRTTLASKGIIVQQTTDLDSLISETNIDELTGAVDSSDDEGSDSSADDGLPLHLERLLKSKQRKKSRKSRKSSERRNSIKEPQSQKLNTPNGMTVNKSQSVNQITSNNNIGNNINNNSLGILADKEKKEKEKESPKEPDKRVLKQILKTQIYSQLINTPLTVEPPRPRSSKPLNNGIPIFTHERAAEREAKKNLHKLRHSTLSDTEAVLYKISPGNNGINLNNTSNTSFNYTTNMQQNYSTNVHNSNFNLNNMANSMNKSGLGFRRSSNSTVLLHQQNSVNLVDVHKNNKKLSDFLIFRNLSSADKFNTETTIQESDGDASDDEIECDGFTEYIQTAQRGSNLKEMNIRSFVSSFLINSRKNLESTDSNQAPTKTPRTTKVHNLNDEVDGTLVKDEKISNKTETSSSLLMNSTQHFSTSLNLNSLMKKAHAKKHDDKLKPSMSSPITPFYMTLAPIVAPILQTNEMQSNARYMINTKLVPKSSSKTIINHRNSYPLIKKESEKKVETPASNSSTGPPSSVSFYSASQLRSQLDRNSRNQMQKDGKK